MKTASSKKIHAFHRTVSKGITLALATGLGIVAALVYFCSMAHYAYPGESAHLMALWHGLDAATNPPYPLMAVFAKLLGGGNIIAPICGVISVLLLFLLVTFFVSNRIHGDDSAKEREPIAWVAGISAALIFMVTPAVREAASHLEPRLFDFMWVLLAFNFFRMAAGTKKVLAILWMSLSGVFAGLGYLDSPVVIALMPLFLMSLVAVCRKRGEKFYLPLLLFAVCFFAAFLIGAKVLGVDLVDCLTGTTKMLRSYIKTGGWLFVIFFSTVPFVCVLFSSNKAYNEKPTLVQWLYNSGMSFVAILAVASPLSPSGLMQTFGIQPVLTSAFAAITAGHLISYWYFRRKKVVAMAVGGVLVAVLLFSCLWNFFTFDGNAGLFADQLARKIIKDLGTRTWFVSDGSIDDNVRLAAHEVGQEVNIIALNRDTDNNYIKSLGDLIREKKVGGPKNEQLALSLSLGVLPFVQDWFAADPDIAQEVAIFGAPDLWYTAGLRPIPEFLFFGADETKITDWDEWKEFDPILKVEKGWGSYRTEESEDPAVRLRQSMRRHVGFVANNRGVYLQDLGHDKEAFSMYELVLKSIDPDNICALFNEMEMANQKFPEALAKQRDLDAAMKKITEDKNRRYYIWRLGSFYGYIRNPDVFVRNGYAWARSGRPGEALSQIKRAIDFVPNDKRAALLNMMAALYANDSKRQQSRQIYQTLLKDNAQNHDALIGLMRLELMDGNMNAAIGYLEKAAQASGDTHVSKVERAMLAMMKGDVKGANAQLRKAVADDDKDLQAWSLLAATAMQTFDKSKDEAEKAKILKELENDILPAMEKEAKESSDYYVQTTKAFILLRKGTDKRREARDALALAAQSRPDVTTTQDLILGLDISLDDPEAAQAHAREVLRVNRNAPLANYVMGSIALGKDENEKAEAFLRKATNGKDPPVIALNDMAEVLRRLKRYDEAESYARKATERAAGLYIVWDTLGSILMDAGKKLDEAEICINKACELSRGADGKESDVRMLISLARVQLKKGDKQRAKMTIRKVLPRVKELSDFEKSEFDALRKSVQ